MVKSTLHSSDTHPAQPIDSEFLVIENLTKAYPTPNGKQFVVLDDIHLTVRENEFVSLIGHSGCGKSTLLKVVAGLEKATSGLVKLEGKEIRKPGMRSDDGVPAILAAALADRAREHPIGSG